MTKKTNVTTTPEPEPERVNVSTYGLEWEFRNQHMESTLGDALQEYAEWIETLEELIEEYGEDKPIAELVAMMDAHRKWEVDQEKASLKRKAKKNRTDRHICVFTKKRACRCGRKSIPA